MINLAHIRWGSCASPVALLFVHGHTSSKETWKPIMGRFLDYDCYAVDLRGHGESPQPTDKNYSPLACARDVKNFIATNIPLSSKIFLIGHSMGTRVVVPLAATYPEQIAGVVIEDLDFSSRPHQRKETDETKKKMQEFQNYHETLESLQNALSPFFNKTYIDKWIETDRIKPYKNGYWSCIHPWVAHQTRKQLLTPSGLDYFVTLAEDTSIPTLSMVPGINPATSPEGLATMKEVMRRIKVDRFISADHSIHRSATDDFEYSLRKFIVGALQ